MNSKSMSRRQREWVNDKEDNVEWRTCLSLGKARHRPAQKATPKVIIRPPTHRQRMSSLIVRSHALVPASNCDHRTRRHPSTDCRSGRYVNTTKTEGISPPTCFDAECTSPLCVHFVFSIALVHRARPMSCDCPLQVCQEDAQDDGHIFLTSTNDERGLCASAPRLQRKELTGQR